MTLKELFTAIAINIRSKTGSSDAIIANEFPEAIADIPDDLTPGLVQGTVTEIKENNLRGCTRIKEAMFKDSIKLMSVQLPNSMETLDKSVFENCPLLETINIPSSITIIPDRCFYEDSNLQLELPNTITQIGNSAFYNCSRIPYINLSEGLTKIGMFAFKGCSRLKTITLPNTLTELAQGSFANCGLTSINIPSGITKIENGTFDGCRSLKTVTLHNNITEISGAAFRDTINLQSITLPNSLTTIGYSAFLRSGLTSINIPNSVTSMEYDAFNYTKITSLIIPEGVNFTGDDFPYILRGCSELVTADLPSTYQTHTVGLMRLDECPKLTNLTLRSNTIVRTRLEDIAKTNLINGYVKVPANLVDSYKSDSAWSTIADRIVAITN